MSVVSFICPQQRRSLGVNVLKGYLVEGRYSPSRVPGEAISKQSQLRHVSPMPSNCCLPKSQTSLGRFWLSQRPFFLYFFYLYMHHFLHLLPVWCKMDRGWQKSWKTNRIILKKLLTDLDEDQPRNIYLKWGLGRNLEISFKVCLLDNKHAVYLLESGQLFLQVCGQIHQLIQWLPFKCINSGFCIHCPGLIMTI